MASAQQKPKRERGTRNSARRNGKAFGKPSSKGKPSFKSCLGVSLVKIAGGGSTDYYSKSFCAAVMDLYQEKASRHGWTEAQAEDKATEWLGRYSVHLTEKRERERLALQAERDRILAEAKLIEVVA